MQLLKKTNMDDLIIQDSVSEAENESKKNSFSLEKLDAWLLSKQKINTKQKVVFFRLLATMVNAGLPMLKSLAILEKQEQSPLLQHLYIQIIEQIKGGKNLSNAMRSFDGMFADAEASIVESGEKTGRLNTALLQLADQVEKVSSISNKIKGALIYP